MSNGQTLRTIDVEGTHKFNRVPEPKNRMRTRATPANMPADHHEIRILVGGTGTGSQALWAKRLFHC